MLSLSQEKGIIENYLAINCYSPSSFYWRLALYTHLGILQISALALAFKTRNVKIPVLNDSKAISASVFITSALNAGLIIVTISLQNYSSLIAFYFYGFVMLSTAVFVGLVFVPKVSHPVLLVDHFTTHKTLLLSYFKPSINFCSFKFVIDSLTHGLRWRHLLEKS